MNLFSWVSTFLIFSGASFFDPLFISLSSWSASYSTDKLLLGRVKTSKSTAVVSPFNGVVSKVFVKSGQELIEGQPLVEVSAIEPGLKSIVFKNHHKTAKVRAIDFEKGAFVGKYQTIMTLVQPEDFIVESELLATKAAHIELGKTVEVSILRNAQGNNIYRVVGFIDEIIDLDNDPITPYRVRIKVDLSACNDAECGGFRRNGALVLIKL